MLAEAFEVIHSLRPHLRPYPTAIVDAMTLSERSIGSATVVADRLGLRSRFQLARLLKREGLPPLHKLAAWLLALVIALALAGAGRANAGCPEPFYRWTAKISTANQGDAPTPTTLADMLKWPAPDLWHPADAHKDCTPRADRENTVYAVTGWAGYMHLQTGAKGDHDLHIELTQGPKTKRCIVVEIPDGQYGAVFQTAKNNFLDLITHTQIKNRRIVPAVQVTVVGLAFFDGEHRGAKGSTKHPHGHGHCNSSSSALWEIHPVYAVTAPGGP